MRDHRARSQHCFPGRRLAAVLAALGALMLAACGGDAGGAGDAATVARGEAIAEQACGNCHGMGPTGESHWAGAEPFRDMHIDLNAITYERRMAQLHAGRVSHMPPADLSLDNVRDIQAYVRSLRRPRSR